MAIKRFTQYITEHPNETDNPVPVSNYFALEPNLSWGPLIPKVIAAVKAGTLVATKQDAAIASLTPTQEMVSLTKVQSYVSVLNVTPGIALHTESATFLFDGHHRACADAAKGLVQTPVRLLSIQQLNDWLAK